MKLKLLLICSLIFNVVFLFKYFKSKPKSVKVKTTAATNKTLPYNNNRQLIFDKFPITENDTVFLGDSQTQQFLFEEAFPGQNFKNRGISADNAHGILNRLHQITDGHPKLVFLQIGINDLTKGNTTKKAALTVDSIIRAFQQRSPSTKVILSAILPHNKLCKGDSVIVYNRLLSEIANDHRLSFFDLYTPFNLKGALNPKYDCGDGLHLNGEGYLLWAKMLKQQLL